MPALDLLAVLYAGFCLVFSLSLVALYLCGAIGKGLFWLLRLARCRVRRASGGVAA